MGLGSWEAVFALNDLTLLCRTKGECSGRARKEVRVRGQVEWQDGWRWGTTSSRVIVPESYLRCQY